VNAPYKVGKKIPTCCENKFYFITRNYILVRIDGGIASKRNFQEPGIYHEKGKGRNHEKLVTQYSKTFWTQIPQIPQI